jgi:hypothetical protein
MATSARVSTAGTACCYLGILLCANQSRATMIEKPDEMSTPADLTHNLSLDGAEEQSKLTVSGLIGDCQKRAKFRRDESYLILLVMLVLLGIAIYVFSQAKDIAANDTSINTTAREQEVESKN